RLTQFRHEVEKELAEEVGRFNPNQLNAAEYVADNAYLAVALAMRMGATGNNVPQPNVAVGIDNNQLVPGATATGSDVTANINIKTKNEGGIFGLETETLNIGTSLVLEQVEQLDQLKRYMDHLN